MSPQWGGGCATIDRISLRLRCPRQLAGRFRPAGRRLGFQWPRRRIKCAQRMPAQLWRQLEFRASGQYNLSAIMPCQMIDAIFLPLCELYRSNRGTIDSIGYHEVR